jgi:hypothetical protein
MVTVVRYAGEQFERFRRAVQFSIPTVFLTGLYQAMAILGTNVSPNLESTIGLAISRRCNLSVGW